MKNIKSEIFKKAIILEKQGRIFYEKIASNTEFIELKQIFSDMAAEEFSHEETLRTQLTALIEESTENIKALENNHAEFTEAVLTDEVTKKISEATYEAAAISAAMGLEVKTFEFYTSLSESADLDEEKSIFKKLAAWENSHLKFLSNLNRKILEQALLNENF